MEKKAANILFRQKPVDILNKLKRKAITNNNNNNNNFMSLCAVRTMERHRIREKIMSKRPNASVNWDRLKTHPKTVRS